MQTEDHSEHTEAVAVARKLYAALAAADPVALMELMTDDFEALVSDGMPLGVGGPHHGAADMLGVWGSIAETYQVTAEPHEFLPVSGDRVIVIGRYRGGARTGDTAIDAAFAHVLGIRGRQVSGLHQITDTAQWGIPIAT